MSADPYVLYREIVGGSDDTEGNKPNGIVVTLSYWHTTNWQLISHYILSSRVMIDHEIIVDEHQLMTVYIEDDPKYLRKAIARFDQLLELNPECKPVEA